MTEISRDMSIREWSGPPNVPFDETPVKAIVFVHGILSDHTTFAECRAEFLRTKPDWRLYYVDYDYHSPIEQNGTFFAAALRNLFRDIDRVVVVAHSMGGLVTRLACLSGEVPFVRTIFLLATPNHGAFRTSSLGKLAQMTRGAVGTIWGLRPKKVGIMDLTRVDKIFAPYLPNAHHTEQIDYISIPGRYFHPSRGFLDHDSANVWKVIFGGLDVGFDLLGAFLPLMSINLRRAHDGVVEEMSNRLAPDPPEQTSEKSSSVRRPLNSLEPATYAHLQPTSAKELMHVEVTKDPFIITIVGEVIDAQSLQDWITFGFPRHRGSMRLVDRDTMDE